MVSKLWQSQLEHWVQRACTLEVTSPKPGNVGPGHEFATGSVDDFLSSASAIAPVLARANSQPLGQTILCAVEATRQVVGHNTNLGIILLLAPLAAVPEGTALADGICKVLAETNLNVSKAVYAAIRLAQPSGLGKSTEQDLREEPTLPLLACMELAADRDLIAKQYTNGFRDVLESGLSWLTESGSYVRRVDLRIQWLAVRLISEFGDSLVERKCGRPLSDQIRSMASELLRAGWPGEQKSQPQYRAFDQFLRADGNQRNPGTTADLVAAILFSALREGWELQDDLECLMNPLR